MTNKGEIVDPNSPEGLAETAFMLGIQKLMTDLSQFTGLTITQRVGIAHRMLSKADENAESFLSQEGWNDVVSETTS